MPVRQRDRTRAAAPPAPDRPRSWPLPGGRTNAAARLSPLPRRLALRRNAQRPPVWLGAWRAPFALPRPGRALRRCPARERGGERAREPRSQEIVSAVSCLASTRCDGAAEQREHLLGSLVHG